MSDLNEKPGEAMAAGVAKATASQTSFAGRIRNYFLTPVWSLLARWRSPSGLSGPSLLGAANPAGLPARELYAVADSRKAHDDGAKDLIPIPDEITWRLIPGKCLS